MDKNIFINHNKDEQILLIKIGNKISLYRNVSFYDIIDYFIDKKKHVLQDIVDQFKEIESIDIELNENENLIIGRNKQIKNTEKICVPKFLLETYLKNDKFLVFCTEDKNCYATKITEKENEIITKGKERFVVVELKKTKQVKVKGVNYE